MEEEEPEEPEEADEDRLQEESEPVLPVPAGGEDWDGAAEQKDRATAAKSAGDFAAAVDHFTRALELGSVSAIALANRAECLIQCKRPLAAISDCSAALAINPDSAKALRFRGMANRRLGRWEQAHLDFAAAQRIDFVPEVEAVRKVISDKVAKIEARKTKLRNKELEAKKREYERRKQAAAAARAAAEAEQEEEDDYDDMPDLDGAGAGPAGGKGMPGGAGGMQQMLMQLMMSDPELAAGFQKPKIQQAFMSVMSGGGPNSPAAAKAMQDPEVKAFMEKVTKKLGPLMGGMGGMPGMGGMGGMGGKPSSSAPSQPYMEPEVEEVD